MTTSQLEPSEIASCLLVDDLTDPASGEHAMQALLTNIVELPPVRRDLSTNPDRRTYLSG